MAFIMSLTVTAALLSPVFLLAGWFREPVRARVRSRFNLNAGPARRF